MTRRHFLVSSATAAAAAALGRAVGSPALAQQAPATPVFTAIRRNVGFFTARGGTIGYLLSTAGIVVVDSQFPDSGKLCVDGLAQQSNQRPVDWLINTHHHGDHTGGNIAFKGVAKKVVAHATAAEHMRQPPGRQAPTTEQLYPDTTFTDSWRQSIGDETVRAKYYGRAHTSGDAVITFERANVAHMGDLMFNRRHPVVDRPAGATLQNWIKVLEQTMTDHSADTIYIFGHAGAQHPVTGNRADLTVMRDYFTALLEFTKTAKAAGQTREQFIAIRDPLKGFESHGPLNAAILGNAYDE